MLLKQNKFKTLFLLFMVTFGEFVAAQSTAEKLRTINEQIVILNAEAKMLDAQLKIKELEGKLKNVSTNTSAPPSVSAKTNGTSKSEIRMVSVFLPRVLAVEGLGDKLLATVSSPDGTKKVHTGEFVSGWLIREITLDRVVFVKDKEVKTVFVNISSLSDQEVGSRVPLALPPLVPSSHQ